MTDKQVKSEPASQRREKINKIEYRDSVVQEEMKEAFGLDFEGFTLAMFEEYGITDCSLMVCHRLSKNGKAVFGQLPLSCKALVSKYSQRMWLPSHYSREDMTLALYHEIHHILYPYLTEDDMVYLEKAYQERTREHDV